MSIEEGAKNAAAVCMGVRMGERVLVLSDMWKQSIARALFNASEALGAVPVLMQTIPMEEGKEPPIPVSKAMLSSDVVFAPTHYSISHTKARLLATKAGVRIASMPGITPREIKGPMTADFEEIAANIRRIFEAVRRKKKIEVHGDGGTDITLNVDGRMWITDDHGLAREKGSFTNLPAGAIFAPIIEKKANGTIVIDGALDNSKVGAPLQLTVKKGVVTEYEGAGEADYLSKKFEGPGRKSQYLSGFGIGMNPKAKIVGHPLQDEIALGTATFYIGENYSFGGRIRAPVRISGIIRKATVKIGEITIIEEGELVF